MKKSFNKKQIKNIIVTMLMIAVRIGIIYSLLKQYNLDLSQGSEILAEAALGSRITSFYITLCLVSYLSFLFFRCKKTTKAIIIVSVFIFDLLVINNIMGIYSLFF